MRRAKSNHLYASIVGPSSTHFMRSQILKIHRNFFHSSSKKLFNLLVRTRPDEATTETLKFLEDLTKRCDYFQRITNAPHLFLVYFGAENVLFNETIIIYNMYIEYIQFIISSTREPGSAQDTL